MSNAVHGKASLAETLLADEAATGKNTDDDRDKTNTVDFAATLMGLIDQATADSPLSSSGAAASTASKSTKHTADPALPAFDLSMVATDRRAAKSTAHETASPATKSHAAAAHTTAASPRVASETTRAINHAFANFSDNQKSTGQPIADMPDDAAPQTKDAKVSEVISNTGKPSADLAIPIQSQVAAAVGLAVPDSDITLDFRKQPFSAAVTDDASTAGSAKTTATSILAKVANTAHSAAKTDLEVSLTPRAPDASRSGPDHATNGTSPALSGQDMLADNMNSIEQKPAPQNAAKLVASDASASSAQSSAQNQLDRAAQIALESQRTRPSDAKDAGSDAKQTASQPTDASAVPNDPAHGAGAQPIARSSEAVAIRQTVEVSSSNEAARTVNITVQLASGQTAQANVREHAGSVDVKILTPTPASAQRISSEMDGMRQNLDAAGLKLGHSEVSYQQGEGGRQHREGYRPPAQNQSANGKEVFIMNEVVQ
jgi:hypothetical protein